MKDDRVDQAVALMTRYADRTGLTASRPARRYLWTDAFAVCNFLGLGRVTGDARYQELALRLVDQVHHELGRHRPDDPRTGWISGLPDADAEMRPTLGGLRIGKTLPERPAIEALDPELEWDRDGQYFHYLTKWMHALDQTARWTGRSTLNVWARELAQTAHRAFTYGPEGHKRMVWKLSIDLSRPLVTSMGQHDPLDGLVTCAQLESTAGALETAAGPDLTSAAEDFAEMLDPGGLETTDPLGLGGLLVDACRLAQLDANPRLSGSLLAATVLGLRRYVRQPDLRAPAPLRLGFRELGLAIGLAGVTMLKTDGLERRLDAAGQASLGELAGMLPIRTQIESFWLRPPHRQTPTWLEHQDINDVMLATSLLPEGFLSIASPRRMRAAANQ